MEDITDDRDTHLGSALTTYCFGEPSESEREAIEQHLFVCDHCWEECRRLTQAVGILRTENALPPPFAPADVVSVFGISSRLAKPFAGHRGFVVGGAALFALQFSVGIWVELGYAYDQFAHLAWWLCWPSGIAAWIVVVVALQLDAQAIRQGRDDGLLRSILVVTVGLVFLTAVVVGVLPAEQTIRASFQTRTASAGYLKDVLVVFAPLLVFILPSFHTVLALQQSLGAGRHEPVLATLGQCATNVPPRGTLYLSPRVLGVVFLVLGLLRLSGANHMLDALSPGPYAQLFAVATYVNVGLWLGTATWSMWWFWTALQELKREALALARLTRHRAADQRSH